MNKKLSDFSAWLSENSDVAALVMTQWLEPVEGKGAIIFPPMYAKPERTKEEDWFGYNIDRFEDGSSICQLDSVGSQANRMEPVFKRDPYSALVPQIRIATAERNSGATEREINLLDAGHRAADAIARFSTLGPRLDETFRAYRYRGDVEPLARISPTSIVFGCWDSQGDSGQATSCRSLRDSSLQCQASAPLSAVFDPSGRNSRRVRC